MNSLKNCQSSRRGNKNTLASLLNHRLQVDSGHVKVKLPSVNKALGFNWEQREICTPFFRERGGNAREGGVVGEQGKRNSRSLFFEHLKVRNMPDLSFGGVGKHARSGVGNL